MVELHGPTYIKGSVMWWQSDTNFDVKLSHTHVNMFINTSYNFFVVPFLKNKWRPFFNLCVTVICPWVSKTYNLQPNIDILVKNNNGTTKNRIAFISMAAILYFLILGLILHFDSVDPVLIGFSMLRTPYMQVFMLSSGSAHVALLMLHIDPAIA